MHAHLVVLRTRRRRLDRRLPRRHLGPSPAERSLDRRRRSPTWCGGTAFHAVRPLRRLRARRHRALGDRRRRARRPRDRPCRARVRADRGTRRPEWSAAVSGFQLAVCSEMVFTDLPIIDRVRRIDEIGFAVEIWSWHDKDLTALADTGARFSSMTGYLHGDLIDPTSADEVVGTAELSIKAAQTLGVPRLNLHTAELVDGKAARPRYGATGEMWTTALHTLERIGELGAAAGVTFCVENLNTIVDHPGVPLARAKDTLALVEGVDHPNVKMMLDLYHAQIGEGNLIELIRRCGNAIGEVQVADVPGRCEPGTGEIFYPAVAKALRDIGFAGTVGMEAWAASDGEVGSEAALDAFRRA